MSTGRWRWAFLILAPVLLWLALRRLDIPQLLRSLQELSAWELFVLLAVNLAAVVALSGRWWIILAGFSKGFSLLKVSAYRLAGFAISYFTPGPQFGGEPLQAYFVWRRDGLQSTIAIASVILDKTIELTVNFAVLVLGVIVLLQLPTQAPSGLLLLLIPLLLMGLPLIYLRAIGRGGAPLSGIAGRLSAGMSARFELDNLADVLDQAEGLAGRYWAGRWRRLTGALAWSAASWLLLLFEYALMARFLGLALKVWEILAILTAARLALLLPVPGGLGALELSQVLMISSLGYPEEAGAALALVIRARDIFFGSMGLAAGSYLLRDPRPGD